jgi:hypothetical protein
MEASSPVGKVADKDERRWEDDDAEALDLIIRQSGNIARWCALYRER